MATPNQPVGNRSFNHCEDLPGIPSAPRMPVGRSPQPTPEHVAVSRTPRGLRRRAVPMPPVTQGATTAVVHSDILLTNPYRVGQSR
jgi:hypothetical protein